MFVFCALVGLCTPMTAQTSFVLLVELVTPHWRAAASMLINGTGGLLLIILALCF